MRFDVNISILFTELEPERRPAAAASAGFTGVESWWPFAGVPGDREVERFVRSVADAGVELVSLNVPHGDLAAGERGLAGFAGRTQEFRDGVDVAAGVAARLGCRLFNVLPGNRTGASREVLLDNLAYAAQRLDTVLLEPLSGAPDYPLLRAADALALADEVGAGDIALLADVYHLGVNGDDLGALLRSPLLERIGHVQVADAPGRHQPGTGTLDVAGWLDRLAATGYDGWVGLEYSPTGSSADSFGWLPAH
ncbi:TIM barrel protein [Amycolatopsis endophytica]|uniref:Hydroxypyruvate isomerase n=1 Tax=Amycolatopsis endophytica TaxID=860233 RepID=A0A853B730_9PSEU|nr:TIM barrel protein [Amycolatopsis endophytica]NYI90879.1 hydroxypyruvate isomerase [Amycolatopsis endophytica]